MSNIPSTEDIRRAAQELFDERVGAVTAVADATRERIAKQAEATEAEQREAAAWAEALRHGWTEKQLRGMGLTVPGRKPPGRARSTRPAGAASPALGPAGTTNGDAGGVGVGAQEAGAVGGA